MMFKHVRNVRGFFSDYYLGSIFSRRGQGARTKGITDREIDLAYARFRRIRGRAEGRALEYVTCRERFLRPLLAEVLGYHLGSSQDCVRGLYASAEAEAAGHKPLLLAYCGAWDEDLDSGRGTRNPMQLTGQRLASEQLGYGLLLTGERARLIRVPGEGPRGAYLEADLGGLAEEEDTESFEAFLRLFSARNYVPDADRGLPIDEIERESRERAQRVSDDLKRAVFTAAESTVSGLISSALADGRLTSPLDLTEQRLHDYRDAALLALYRILFILYAEARDPRLGNHPLYRDSYSVQGLLEEILRDPGRVWPENRCSMWERLRAVFRIYDEGFPAITPWSNIPPRGGDFFSRRTAAGRILDEARLPDRTVARLMLDLATSTPRPGVGRERVSFAELDIENLGAVYEGLLQYEPRIAAGTVVELNIQGREYALVPSEVVRLCKERDVRLVGDVALIQGTEAEHLAPRQPGAEEEADSGQPQTAERAEVDGDRDSQALDAEGSEEEGSEEEAVEKGATARLVRRLERGQFYFVPGPSRKGSGSFYTPRPLVRDLVHHALGPIVEQAKTAAEIERLRVLDPACGSAHFLVEAMRFLGQALHRAYVEEYAGKTPPAFRSTTGHRWDTEWKASDEEARAANSEARAWCKRRIAERCLFGVDLNPTAVQLARVALWIESVAGDRPLTYFEHHIRCGNSLLGTWMERLEEPPRPGIARRESRNHDPRLFQGEVRKAVQKAAERRRAIDEATWETLLREGIEPESTEEQRYKEQLRRGAEEALATAKLLFDLRSASAFIPEIWEMEQWHTLCSLVSEPGTLIEFAQSQPWWTAFRQTRQAKRFFHWQLEFPEVFLGPGQPGLDAVVGNPPWDKVKPDRKEFYGRYDVLIRAFVGGELDRRIQELEAALPGLADDFRTYEKDTKTVAACLSKGGDYRFNDWVVGGKTTGGDPDAFKFFVERAWLLAREGGRVGFLVPSAIYNNESCTGLRHLILDECTVERFYAFENRKKIFPIDSRYKFVSLVLRKARSEADGFEAAFMRHDLEELDATACYRESGQERARPRVPRCLVPIRRNELERISPGTLAFLEYRDPRDREIILKMYGYDADGNPVCPRPLLRDQGPGTWNARFYSEFHMTADRDFWTDPRSGKLYNPRGVLGPVPGTTDKPPYYDAAAWPEIRARMAEAGFWPLYEGKHIEQFLVDIKPIERWVSLETCEKKYHRTPEGSSKLIFRAIASNTNERTCIAAVLPQASCFGNSCWGCVLSRPEADMLCTVLNSLPVDFAVRLRVSSNMNWTHAARMPVLQPGVAGRVRDVAIGTQSTTNAGVAAVVDAMGSWASLWSANRAVAEAYGLGPADFQYILSTFSVLRRKRPTFFAYMTQCVSGWERGIG